MKLNGLIGLDFQNLVQQIALTMIRGKIKRLLQSLPLFSAIKACLSQCDDSGMDLETLGEIQKIADIQCNHDQVMVPGVPPDINVRLTD